MIYTSYFYKMNKLPAEIVPIAICAKAPNWYYDGQRLQYKKLAPKYDFFKEWKRTHDNAYYTTHFLNDVLAPLNASEVVAELTAMAQGKSFALLCYERPSDFCHRHLVADWLCKNGYPCEELNI